MSVEQPDIVGRRLFQFGLVPLIDLRAEPDKWRILMQCLDPVTADALDLSRDLGIDGVSPEPGDMERLIDFARRQEVVNLNAAMAFYGWFRPSFEIDAPFVHLNTPSPVPELRAVLPRLEVEPDTFACGYLFRAYSPRALARLDVVLAERDAWEILGGR